MAKLDLKKISAKNLARIATATVLLLSIGAVAMMAIFIYQTLNRIAYSSFALSEVEQESIETIDLTGLAALQARLDEKNALDEPRAGRPHNPFADISIRKETVLPSGVTPPTPEPEPPVSPPPTPEPEPEPEPEAPLPEPVGEE